jgi:hypothetical protein
MKMADGNFTRTKKWIAGVVGVGVLYGSLIFSKNGFQFEVSDEYAWLGWLLASAATSAQFMMTSDFRKINWSILTLGIAAYIYSIYTNIIGFHSLREGQDVYDLINVLGAVFMDVYPEVAIAWALGESKLGDLVGNLIQSAQTPKQLTNRGNGNDTGQSRAFPQSAQKSHRPDNGNGDIPEFLRQHMKGKRK